MLKMVVIGERDGKRLQVVILGLSAANIRLLQGDRPIVVKGNDVGLMRDVEILIFAGSDERAMAAQVEGLIGPDTEIKISAKLQD